MQFNVDKRFIEILNSQGVQITWKQFREANNTRRAERESTPAFLAKQEEERQLNKFQLEIYRALLAK